MLTHKVLYNLWLYQQIGFHSPCQRLDCLCTYLLTTMEKVAARRMLTMKPMTFCFQDRQENPSKACKTEEVRRRQQLSRDPILPPHTNLSYVVRFFLFFACKGPSQRFHASFHLSLHCRRGCYWRGSVFRQKRACANSNCARA